MEPHKDQIVLSKRQISMIMASMVIFCLFVFIVGFFLGKRVVVDEFSSNVTQNALHDQIDYLLTSQSLQSSQEEIVNNEESQEHESPLDILELKDQNSTESLAESLSSVEPIGLTKDIKVSHTKISENNNKKSIEPDIYDPQYACLIGFGTKQAANAFVVRLKKHHITVILKTIISKTASGKVRTWYQAITPTYDSATELQEVVRKIKRLEHIRDHDIQIIHVKK